MNLFLLVLRILLDLSLDINYKDSEFSKTLLEKDHDFVQSKGDDTVIFNLGLVLLPAKINPIPEKQSYKRNALRVYGNGYVKIVLAPSTNVVTLYMGATIVQVGVSGLKSYISGYGVYFAIFLALNQ